MSQEKRGNHELVVSIGYTTESYRPCQVDTEFDDTVKAEVALKNPKSNQVSLC